MSNMYTRQKSLTVNSDRPIVFKRSLNKKSREEFDRDRQTIWNRRKEYIPDVAKTMAASYKTGVVMFPSHYEYAGKSYELEEPKVLSTSEKKERNKNLFIQGCLQQIIADGQRDRLAVLILGLVHAQKIPHWFGYEEESLAHDAFSETELESD